MDKTERHQTQAAPAAPRSDALSPSTLVITAVASGAAALLTAKVWAPGTFAFAATVPVLVALIKEAIARPAQTVTTAVPRRRRGEEAPTQVQDPATAALHPLPGGHPEAEGSAEPPADWQPVKVHGAGTGGGVRGALARRWKVALVTGLLGFAICAVVLTVTDFAIGGSPSNGKATTIWGGGSGDSSSSSGDEDGDERDEQRTTTSESPDEDEPAQRTRTTDQADEEAEPGSGARKRSRTTAEPEATATPSATASPSATATATATPPAKP